MSGPTLESVLLRHEITWEPRAYPSYECCCGWNGALGDDGGADDGRHDTQQAATAHVAAAVLAWIEGRLADGDVRAAVAGALERRATDALIAATPNADGSASVDISWTDDADAALAAVGGVLGAECRSEAVRADLRGEHGETGLGDVGDGERLSGPQSVEGSSTEGGRK